MRISDWSSDVCSSDLALAEDVDPTIGDPIVPERNGRPTAPRLHPRLGARFEHRKNVVGDGLINVDPVRFLSHFPHSFRRSRCLRPAALTRWRSAGWGGRSEEHTSELPSLMRISYAVFCLKKKNR